MSLSEASDEGHVFLPKEELVKRSLALLEAEAEQVAEAVEALEADKSIEHERLLDVAISQPTATVMRETATPYALAASEADPWAEPPLPSL